MIKKALKLIGLFFLCTLVLAPTSGVLAETTNLNFYSASPGGMWYPMAVAAGSIWERSIPDVKIANKPGGGVANVMAIDGGQADVAMSVSVSIGAGIKGIPPFKKAHPNVKALATFYPVNFVLTVWQDSGINEIKDLKGKRLGAGIKGYTAESLVKLTLEAVGLTYQDMRKVEFISDNKSVDLMKDGHLDAFADTSASLRDPSLVDLSINRPIRILDIPDSILETFQKESPGLFRAYIPKGSYNGIDADVPVIASKLGLIVRPELSDELVYQLTKSLVENWEKDMHPVSKLLKSVEPQKLAEPLGVEFHPGALKYYKERGWIK